tara:strand:- start:362 stop:919 length:558 start_codon:yes stop_codon:yes gene_type:complete
MMTAKKSDKGDVLAFVERMAALTKPLSIEQIEFRVGAKIASGQVLMAYKTARVDMDRLDQCVGQYGWQRRHEIIDGQLFCHVGIWSPFTNEWVWKSDVGVESRTEAEKGRASDSFKRACTNWGIGRELYSMPKIIVDTKENIYPQYWQWEAWYRKTDNTINALKATYRNKTMFEGKWDDDNRRIK